MPAVSVIIPAYNCTQTIRETLQSVLYQTLTDFEVIVIDDGSTDDLGLVLSEFTDSRIQVFHYENGGLSIARNRGIDQATGDYLIFLDADDLWTPNKLQSHFNLLEFSPGISVAYSWLYILEDVTQDCTVYQPTIHNGDVLVDLFKRNFIANGSNAFIRRSAIDRVGYFCQEFGGASDWDYWLRLAHYYHFMVSPEPQVFYRQAQSSMSSNIESMKDCMLAVIDCNGPNLVSNQKLIQSQARSNVYLYCAKLACERIQKDCTFRTFFTYLLQGFKYNFASIFNREVYRILVRFIIVKWMPNSAYQLIKCKYRIIKSYLSHYRVTSLSDFYE